MALGYRARKRLALLVLVVGLPAWIALAWWITSLLPAEMPAWIEFAVYVVLGVIWAVPLRFLFLGVAQPDPEAGPAIRSATKSATDRDRRDPR
ncbi:DUF2842 domain-containing protein [Acidimangrovimonas sediminis]|uniref:DUF2842 domain-containing protein n=1 Tax=Acidimangrovimonas sediminis TaxID=2056283 RepID=UPI000C80E5FE|nr:DUF2842 domain-containing protein [Acidimangrovimonas sediminis]